MKKHFAPRPVAARCGFFTLALGAALASLPPLAAQTGEEFHVSAGFGYRTDADIDNHSGDFNETRFNLTAARPVKLNDQWRLDPIVGYSFGAYDFSKANLWDDIHQVRGTVLARVQLDEKWAVFGGPTLGFAAESDADASQAFTFGAAVGVTYKVSDHLTIGGGLGVTSEIEDNARLRPLLILNWQINEHWSLESGNFEVAGASGPGMEITYKLNDQWSVGGGGQYQERRFRLSEDGPVKDGVGEDTSVPFYAKVKWQMSKNAAIELLGGITFGGQLRVEDSQGQKIAEEDYDPSALFGVRAMFTF